MKPLFSFWLVLCFFRTYSQSCDSIARQYIIYKDSVDKLYECNLRLQHINDENKLALNLCGAKLSLGSDTTYQTREIIYQDKLAQKTGVIHSLITGVVLLTVVIIIEADEIRRSRE